jgi:Flp pilus assembly protein TadB
MSEQRGPAPDAKTRVIAAWAGAGLAVIGVVGLVAAPGARLVWIVFLIFGVATIPQVLFWRHAVREGEGEEAGGGDG